MQRLKYFISAVLLLLVLIFAVQNVATVELSLLVWTVSLPRSVMVFSILFIGIILGWLLRGGASRRR